MSVGCSPVAIAVSALVAASDWLLSRMSAIAGEPFQGTVTIRPSTGSRSPDWVTIAAAAPEPSPNAGLAPDSAPPHRRSRSNPGNGDWRTAVRRDGRPECRAECGREKLARAIAPSPARLHQALVRLSRQVLVRSRRGSLLGFDPGFRRGCLGPLFCSVLGSDFAVLLGSALRLVLGVALR